MFLLTIYVLYVCISMYVCVYIRMYICRHLYIYVCMYVCVCMYVLERLCESAADRSVRSAAGYERLQAVPHTLSGIQREGEGATMEDPSAEVRQVRHSRVPPEGSRPRTWEGESVRFESNVHFQESATRRSGRPADG